MLIKTVGGVCSPMVTSLFLLQFYQSVTHLCLWGTYTASENSHLELFATRVAQRSKALYRGIAASLLPGLYPRLCHNRS